MTRKITGLVLIALIAMSVVGWAVQYPLTVLTLSVEGNDEVKLRDILEVIQFEVGDAIEEAELRMASQAIYDLGWFGEVAMDYAALERGDIVFQVVENPTIREIVITGNVNRRDYSLFGIKLYDARIMPTYMIRTILWRNDIRKREVLNREGLTTSLEEISAEYQRRGYPLISYAVEESETFRIELLEPKYSGNLVVGLVSVPETIVQEMVELPLDKPLAMADFSRAYGNLGQSVYFSNVEYATLPGTEEDSFLLQWTLEERTLLASPEAIEAIEIEGNTVYSDGVLDSLIGELPDGPIDNYELLELVQGVYDRYIQGGYAQVELSVAPIEGGVLRLNIAEGAISQVTILGNTRTHDYVIVRNSELEPGEVYNRKDGQVTYQQLMSLGYFRSVDIVPEWGDSGVEITVTVTEKADLGGFGGSMAIDPSTGELFGELSLKEKNVFGTGQDLELSYSRGLVGTEDSSPSTWNLGYSTVAYFPGFDRVGIDLYQKTEEVTVDEVAAVNVTLGMEVSFSYPVADYSNLGLAFRHEEEHMTNEAHWIPADVINLSLAYDDTNDPFFPTEGSRRRLSLEKAGGFSAGREYTRFDLIWTQFVPTTMSMVSTDMDQALAVRIKAGWGDERVPTSQRTELGGSMSIRGVLGDPVRQYILSNVEYRLELVEGLYATAFWDAGFDLGEVRFKDLRSSFGFELGINAAGIIVRLDLAWTLSEDFTWVPVFDFGFGQMF